jgi:hypothetical protein
MGIDFHERQKRGMSQDVAERWQERHVTGDREGSALPLSYEPPGGRYSALPCSMGLEPTTSAMATMIQRDE